MAETRTRETTAREWLVLLVVGVVVAVIGLAAGPPVAFPLGVLLALVGVAGIAWRLLAGR
jgi:hypothetical protein